MVVFPTQIKSQFKKILRQDKEHLNDNLTIPAGGVFVQREKIEIQGKYLKNLSEEYGRTAF
jgi:hypothetical protein